MKKKSLVLFLTLIVMAFSANAQIKNTFIRKNKFVLYPLISYGKDVYNKKTYSIKIELAYLPLNRFEIRPGIRYSFGNQHALAFSMATRYYLLKSKFTIFPEINTWGIYNFQDKKTLYFYAMSFGIGYYGIFKRIGIDLIIAYNPKIKYLYPSLKLKVLLGKLDKDNDNQEK